MFIDVDKLIFKKLENEIVDNSKFTNMVSTSYPHRNGKDMLLKNKRLSSVNCSYNHIHSTY